MRLQFQNSRGVSWSCIAMILLVAFVAACSRQSSDTRNTEDQSKPLSNSPGEQHDRQVSAVSGEVAEQTSLERGVEFLLIQQSDDGLWRSEYYGNLKQGAATTAFVLYALAHAKPYIEDWPEEEFQKAFTALQPAIRKHGFVTNEDGPDYSNYGSAMYLVAALRTKTEIPEDIESSLVEFLIESQLEAGEGYPKDEPDYGGWDLSGWMRGERQSTGTNISVSSVVIEALAAYAPLPKPETEPEKQAIKWLGEQGRSENSHQKVIPTLEKAIAWLDKVQSLHHNDAPQSKDKQPKRGGFFFHPKRAHDGNKAQWLDEQRDQPRSYGTATADGYRSLLLLETIFALRDRKLTHSRFQFHPKLAGSAAWLNDHQSIERVPGFGWEESQNGWREGLLFYYWYARSKAGGLWADFTPLTKETSTSWRLENNQQIAKSIVEFLGKIQKRDGSWQNRVARMREDDPLIATGFAVIALAEAKRIGIGTFVD